MKPSELPVKSNSTANPAITRYRCIICSQVISHDKRYTDRKGRPIPLTETGKNRHECLVENHPPIRKVVEDDKACGCTSVTPNNDDDWDIGLRMAKDVR